MKKLVKRIGRLPIDLRLEDEAIIGQSILIVDNGYSWPGQLHAGIQRIKNYFPKARISVLTFEQRKCDLQNDFPDLNYVLIAQEAVLKRYQVALGMFKLRRQRFDSIVLLSLDISPIIAALTFFRSKVRLYNQWGQWWSLRLRNVSELGRRTYAEKKARFSLKNLLKSIGLVFVLLRREDEQTFRHRIAVIDNGYASDEHITSVLWNLRECLPGAQISVLALRPRNMLQNSYPEATFIRVDKSIIVRYSIARHMFKLRKNRYDYIILLSLDITPILVSPFLIKDRLLLYNQWYQWWRLRPKPLPYYLRDTFKSTANIFIFIYLLFSVLWIFIKIGLRPPWLGQLREQCPGGSYG